MISTNSCREAPLVEALLDGRLSASDAASLERHLAVCTTCAAEKRSYDRIREGLRAPREPATELEHQRARGALLRAAANNGAVSVRAISRPRSYLMLAAAAAFFIGVLGTGYFWGRASAPRAALSAAPPVVFVDTSVVPSDGARFERSRAGGVDTVTLSSGTLAIATGTKTTERLLVKTTDAELESKNGAFHVEADSGRIRNVVVERGTVEVRYAGFIAVIPAGGSWHGGETAALEDASTHAAPPSPAAPATAVAVVSPPEPPASPAAPPTPHSVARTHAPEPTPPLAAPASAAQSAAALSSAVAVAPPPPPVPPSGKAFSSAMHTLEHGDFDGAATALGAFADAHPDDPRSDDADYVRAIALQRAGHNAEAKAAAQRYLANRPNGAHRKEAQQIANR